MEYRKGTAALSPPNSTFYKIKTNPWTGTEFWLTLDSLKPSIFWQGIHQKKLFASFVSFCTTWTSQYKALLGKLVSLSSIVHNRFWNGYRKAICKIINFNVLY